MKKRTTRILALLLTLVLCVSLAACGNGAGDNGNANTGDGGSTNTGDGGNANAGDSGATSGATLDVLNIGLGNTMALVQPFDPGGSWAGGTGSSPGQGYLIYDSLFNLNGETGTWETRILEDYYWEDDLTLVCQLRPDIYFSNGDQLLGDDVLYSISLMQTGRRGSYYAPANLEKSTVSDDGLTITIRYDSVYAPAICFLDCSIVNKDYIEAAGGGENIDWYDPAQLVGSGPYAVESYIPNNNTVYVKRDDYWGLNYGYDFPIEKINATLYSDLTTMMIDFETGELDVAIDISLSDAVRAQSGAVDDCEFGLMKSNVTMQLIFTYENPVLSDPVVREAICHGIDTNQLTSTVRGILGGSVNAGFAPGMKYAETGMTYDYNPEYSRELLAGAGYTAEDLTFNFRCINQSEYTGIAEAVQAYMAEIGITVNVEPLEMATYIGYSTEPGGTDFMLYTMSGGSADGEPHTMLANWMSSSKTTTTKRDNPAYNDAVVGAASTHDEKERAAYYSQLQQLWYDNFDLVPLYEWYKGYVYNPNVLAKCEVNGGSTLDVLAFVPAG